MDLIRIFTMQARQNSELCVVLILSGIAKHNRRCQSIIFIVSLNGNRILIGWNESAPNLNGREGDE